MVQNVKDTDCFIIKGLFLFTRHSVFVSRNNLLIFVISDFGEDGLDCVCHLMIWSLQTEVKFF